MSEQYGGSSRSRTGSCGLIYVVDDEVMLLELATIILETCGYAVKTFHNPKLALAAFTHARARPILLITDYAMNNMNGLALIAACRRLEPTQKTLLVSGTVDEDIYQDSVYKPDAFVAKPYHARQLVEKVRSTLASQSSDA